jgi:putative ABC transport system ATP-binding protein
MHVLSFLTAPTGGHYSFKNKKLEELTEDQMAELRNQEIGFVFQSFNLLPRTSVFENVQLPLIYSKTPKEKHASLVNAAIKAVGLEHRKDYMSNQLSGGEKQRVAIARALVNEPKILFADEPTGNLDSKAGNQIMKIIQDLNEQGKTIIMVTHEQDTADHSKRILYLLDGKLTKDYKVTNRRIAKDGDDLKK